MTIVPPGQATDKQLLDQGARTTNQLWLGTGSALGVLVFLLVLMNKAVPVDGLVGTIIGTWLAALGGKAVVGRYQFKDFRQSDYGALDRQATIEAAKASAPAATTTKVEAGGVAVTQAPGSTQVNADAGGDPPSPPPRASSTHDPGA